MVSRLRTRRHEPAAKPRKTRTRTRMALRVTFEIGISVIIAGIFLLKIVNYVDPEALLSSAVARTITTDSSNFLSMVENIPFLNRCSSRLNRVDISGGYVCVPSRSADDAYDTIYTSYPLVGRGRESIYSSTDEGSIRAANDLLRDKFDLPRYPPIRFPSLPTWSENPHNAQYWRFEFYSLRPSLNLLYAFRTTGEVTYARQLLRIDLGFIDAESHSRWAWADPHAVAFRSMSLVDTWWKLRQDHQLPEAASMAILGELEKTGQFLADPNHYQPGENYATDETAALYELAVAFPTLPHAQQWLATAEQRFQWQFDDVIDADGQLIDNSPYYDFSALEKYWQIYRYSLAQGYPVSRNFGTKLEAMINFATYILQPNSQVPLMGASVETTINDFGVYSQMAASNPSFGYVLTRGAQGSVPPKTSLYFPASALTVMRSGWGNGTAYANSTYLTYYAGKYRNAHSDLDALDLTLYGDGGDLLTDPGLDTYSPGPYRDYFHGTMSHNTVAVDGRSQSQGDGTAEPLVTRDGLTYQSAESSLYGGVTHRRMVMMVDPDHVLVVDRLSSSSVHTYQQMFHLFPGAKLSAHGLTVSGSGGSPRREITIQQLLPGGIAESSTINHRGSKPGGLCSEKYGQLLPCYAVSYSARGTSATFVTLLTIGAPRSPGFAVAVSGGGQHLRIVDGQRDLSVSLGESTAVAPTSRAANPAPPQARTTPVAAASVPADWSVSGAGSLSSAGSGAGASDAVVRLSTSSRTPVRIVNNAIRLNLEHQNARLRLRVTGLEGVDELRLRFSNDHWATWVTTNLLHTYTRGEAGEWVNLFLGPSGQWGSDGGWQASAPGFNWARIDGMEIEIVSQKPGGPSSAVSLGGLALIPAQKEGKLVFVFDGGSQSILPAASLLHQNGMAGNVAVIGKNVDYPVENYLNVAQLKQLQNDWGWDMVNETQQGADAVEQYYDQHHLAAYASDIVHQAVWLEDNRLNSAPNWFVYPEGSTNTALAKVVGRFYKFAQVTADGPDAYPYGDPREAAGLQVEYPGDGQGEHARDTPPAQILATVHEAMAHHLTLILAFNQIYSEPGSLPGYPLTLFRKIVAGVHRSGIKVMTLSQLDASNGVKPINQIYASAGRPSQITVQIRD
jgi:hypothetical protein